MIRGSRKLGERLTKMGLTLSVMESCTGGLFASSITDVPGSSRYFKGGLVAYSSEVKSKWGVDRGLIERFGVVSPQVAEEMAMASRRNFLSDIGIGITGVAGPEPLEGKQPGTVYIAIDIKGEVFHLSPVYKGLSRSGFKRQVVRDTILHLIKLLK